MFKSLSFLLINLFTNIIILECKGKNKKTITGVLPFLINYF